MVTLKKEFEIVINAMREYHERRYKVYRANNDMPVTDEEFDALRLKARELQEIKLVLEDFEKRLSELILSGDEQFRNWSIRQVNMKWVEVESSNLNYLWYDRRDKRLHIVFRSGAYYTYEKVSYYRYWKLRTAESKGKYFNAHIRKKYIYTRREGG